MKNEDERVEGEKEVREKRGIKKRWECRGEGRGKNNKIKKKRGGKEKVQKIGIDHLLDVW